MREVSLIRHINLCYVVSIQSFDYSDTSQKAYVFYESVRVDTVRRFIFSSVFCTRLKASRSAPIMGNLSFQVKPHRPFLHVGLDYGGPLILKESRRRKSRTTKAYLALKTVYQKVVSDVLIKVFLVALDSFIAHRGIPSNLYAVFAINYMKTAQQLITLLNDSKIQE